MEIVQIAEELERLETIISRNQQSFYEIGMALTEIRDKKLYRDVSGFKTFEEYCKRRWDFSSSRARQFIMSSGTVNNIKSVTIVTPTTESQTRPLARLEPEQQVAAWQKAINITPEGKTITASLVSRVVREMQSPEEPSMKDINIQPDSQRLFNLKRLWQAAFKKEKQEFIQWIKDQGDI
jgi:hypothetical protein